MEGTFENHLSIDRFCETMDRILNRTYEKYGVTVKTVATPKKGGNHAKDSSPSPGQRMPGDRETA